MSVLGAPEPAPAGLWEDALDHALSATDDPALELLVPDLWNEPEVPVDGPGDVDEIAWDDRDPGSDSDTDDPWPSDDPAADDHETDRPDGDGDPDPWPAP